MSYPRILILYADDWQGFFVEGELIVEGHTLGDGCGIISFLKHMSKEYNFTLLNVKEGYVDDLYMEYLEDYGNFHDELLYVTYNLKEKEDEYQ